MQTNDTRERLNSAGLEVDYRKTEEFGGYLKDQRTRFADMDILANSVEQIGAEIVAK